MKSFSRFFFVLCMGVFLMAALGVVFEVKYLNRVYPGVIIAGIPVGGKTQEEMGRLLTEKLKGETEIKLAWGTSDFRIDFETIDFEYDLQTTQSQALSYARKGNLSENIKAKWALISGEKASLPVHYFWNENKLNEMVTEIATQLDIPAREPEYELSVDKKTVNVVNGEDGQEVNKRDLVFDIRRAMAQGGEDVEIEVRVISPRLTEQQLHTARMRAMKLVGKKLIATFTADNTEWEASDTTMFSWIDPTGSGYRTADIDAWVGQLSQAVNREAQNATFRFVEGGKVEEFKPARKGYMVDTEATRKLVLAAISELENSVTEKRFEVITQTVDPVVKTGEINNLGIKELIGKGESWFSGSITNRIFNLQKAAAALNGVLVPPGDTFSFNKTIGEISGATGYKQAYVIKDGKTLLGDGGGVCQVSSTLFRAVLNAGLPIDERIAHAFRVSYYEEKYQPGFDATIFQPSPDFKFRNDTPHHILIQTEFDEKNKHLVFLLYGTSDGRVATVSKARIWDVVPPPPPLYQEDPTIPVGKVVQTEHSANGSKVAFDWKVTRGDEVLQERTFFSSYRPWQAVFLRGTRSN